MRYFLIAGEVSGDQLGAALMTGLKQVDPQAEFLGVGGAGMMQLGMTSLFPMRELSLMGLWEVLPKYRHLKRRIAQTAAAVVAARPDVLITIDSPDFGLRVARLVHQTCPDMLFVHYVAPSVWAWRPGRAVKMAQVIDHVLALLPFEPKLMQAAGMSCDFVGHPIATESVASAAQVAQFRQDHNVDDAAPVVLCLPGSRQSELRRLMPRFGQALARVREQHPDMRVILPTIAHLTPLVQEMTTTWSIPPLVLDDPQQKRAAFGAAHLALAASGTVSLDLALHRVPMVIAYDMAPLSRWILGMMVKTDTVTLVNLVTQTRTIPEFLGRNCRAESLATALDQLMSDPSLRQAQCQAMDICLSRLGQGGEAPGLRAARSVVAALKRRQPQ